MPLHKLPFRTLSHSFASPSICFLDKSRHFF
jgi:hypothetical protein